MKKIKTALLSYGMSGKIFHAPFLEVHPGFELVGAWERSHKNIENDYRGAKSYSSLEELLEDDIDLVIVNTPVETHYEYAKKSLLARKHTLVEKAFTASLAQAEELKGMTLMTGLKLSVFHNRRWDSDFKTLKDILYKGVLGDIVEVEFHFDRYNPELSAKLHKETDNPGAGILRDLAPHIIDQALDLFGLPEAVFADIRITRQESLVDDYVDILLYFARFRVRLKTGFFVRESNPAYVIHGEMGSFLKHRGDVQEDALKAGQKPGRDNWGIEPKNLEGILHTEVDGKIIREKVATLAGNYYDFYEGLYESILYDKPEPVTAQNGVNVMRIIEAATMSNKEKRVVEL